MTLLLNKRRHVSLLQSPIRHPWNGLNFELPDHVLGVQRQEGCTPTFDHIDSTGDVNPTSKYP